MGNLSSASSLREDVNDLLIAACKSGNCIEMNQRIVDGADINCCDSKSNTPLMWSAGLGHIECLEALLRMKVKIEAMDSDGYTALHWSVAQRKLDSVRILIKHNANINASNNQGDTPLHRACHYGHKSIAEALIKAGAVINIKNHSNQTPFDKSRKKEFKIWFYGMGGRPNTTQFDTEGIPDINNNNNNNNNINGNGDKVGVGNNDINDINDEKAVEMNDAQREILMKNAMKEKVKEWLLSLALQEYYNIFVDNGYDRFDSCIYEMSKDDLKEIGVKIGHIKIMLKSLNEMKKEEENIAKEQPGMDPGIDGNNDNNYEMKENSEMNNIVFDGIPKSVLESDEKLGEIKSDAFKFHKCVDLQIIGKNRLIATFSSKLDNKDLQTLLDRTKAMIDSKYGIKSVQKSLQADFVNNDNVELDGLFGQVDRNVDV